jgi:hypothetical protein
MLSSSRTRAAFAAACAAPLPSLPVFVATLAERRAVYAETIPIMRELVHARLERQREKERLLSQANALRAAAANNSTQGLDLALTCMLLGNGDGSHAWTGALSSENMMVAQSAELEAVSALREAETIVVDSEKDRHREESLSARWAEVE